MSCSTPSGFQRAGGFGWISGNVQGTTVHMKLPRCRPLFFSCWQSQQEGVDCVCVFDGLHRPHCVVGSRLCRSVGCDSRGGQGGRLDCPPTACAGLHRTAQGGMVTCSLLDGRRLLLLFVVGVFVAWLRRRFTLPCLCGGTFVSGLLGGNNSLCSLEAGKHVIEYVLYLSFCWFVLSERRQQSERRTPSVLKHVLLDIAIFPLFFDPPSVFVAICQSAASGGSRPLEGIKVCFNDIGFRGETCCYCNRATTATHAQPYLQGRLGRSVTRLVHVAPLPGITVFANRLVERGLFNRLHAVRRRLHMRGGPVLAVRRCLASTR